MAKNNIKLSGQLDQEQSKKNIKEKKILEKGNEIKAFFRTVSLIVPGCYQPI